MDNGYETFTMADPVFYDTVYSVGSDSTMVDAGFVATHRPAPDGWRRWEADDWIGLSRLDSNPPLQGWKIHVSANPDNASRVVDIVRDFCLDDGVDFKFLRSPAALIARLSKYAPRGYSGKLATIYPVDDAACESILRRLGELLDGEAGPYILTDLRWRSGPLYVRYGGFAIRYTTDERGRRVPAIVDPDGRGVPDRRDPVFTVPPWVALPDFLAPELAARNAVTVDDMPYLIDRVLHFSNGGGIYAARHRVTGRPVVLKEARPYAGLDAYGEDAVHRLRHEHGMLLRLSGIPAVPEVFDLFDLGDHLFCAMEHVDGTPLNRALVLRYPLIDPTATRAEYDAFTAWALDIHRQVEEAVDQIHACGVVYGDLHLFNIMVDDDGKARLLDFEVSADTDRPRPPGLGNQGFNDPSPRPDRSPFEVDRYALACLRLALFLPMTSMLWLYPAKARRFAAIIAEYFDVPDAFLDEALQVLAPPTEGTRTAPLSAPSLVGDAADVGDSADLFEPDRWPALRDQLASAIVASATPDRDDRLFPGDTEQFAVGGLGLAYGAAGVLYALSVAGAGRWEKLEAWWVKRVLDPPEDTRPGLLDGLLGSAYVLERFGYRQPALDTVERCLAGGVDPDSVDLASGLAGIGLALLDMASLTGENELAVAGLRAADQVADRFTATDDHADGDLDGRTAAEIEPAGEISGGEKPHAGLIRGASGSALLMLRAYDETGDTGFLRAASTALRRDLRHCVVRPSGAWEVNEGWRSMPYLDVGSVGIGLVLNRYLARCDDPALSPAAAGIAESARAPMYILPALFSGRAGILAYLADLSTHPGDDPEVLRQLRALAWHALPYGGGIAFPGIGLLRLSMDLATGTAGVLLAAAMAVHDRPVPLPIPGIEAPAPTGAGMRPTPSHTGATAGRARAPT